VDWEKFGQAFSSGANVLAGGLMDKYQRQKDLQDWQEKQKLATTIQMDEEERRWGQAEKVRREQAFRDSLKNDIETNPELQPFMERHLQGDPEASRIMSIYAGSKYKMYQDTPLSSEEISALAPLPPGVRHTIIRSHLAVLRKRADEDLARTSKEKENKLRDARIKELTSRVERADTEKGAAEAAKIRAGNVKSIEERTADRERKQTAIQQLDTNILTLQQYSDEKMKEEELTKGDLAKAAVRRSKGNIDLKIQQAQNQKKKLEADLQREADVLRKKRPNLFPEEAPNPPAEGLSPDAMEFLAALPDDDKLEIQKAIKARPDLSQEVIIRAYIAHKRQANPVSPPSGRGW